MACMVSAKIFEAAQKLQSDGPITAMRGIIHQDIVCFTIIGTLSTVVSRILESDELRAPLCRRVDLLTAFRENPGEFLRNIRYFSYLLFNSHLIKLLFRRKDCHVAIEVD